MLQLHREHLKNTTDLFLLQTLYLIDIVLLLASFLFLYMLNFLIVYIDVYLYVLKPLLYFFNKKPKGEKTINNIPKIINEYPKTL